MVVSKATKKKFQTVILCSSFHQATNVDPLTSKIVMTVDGLVLPKKPARVEAVAMTTVDTT